MILLRQGLIKSLFNGSNPKILKKGCFIFQSFLLAPVDGAIRFFNEFKTIFLVKENQNLDDKTV